MRNNRLLSILSTAVIATIAVAITGCINPEKPENSATRGTITVMCDNSFENIMEQEVGVFEFTYPDAHILVRYLPQGQAVDSLMSLDTKTIVISRDLTKEERQRLKNKDRVVRGMPIAVDAVALIVNKENPLDEISIPELKMIFSGEITKWEELAPDQPDKPIAVLFDDNRSSMVEYVTDSLNNGQPLKSNVFSQGSIDSVICAVKRDPTTIGVVGVSWLTDDLKSVEQPMSQRVAELNDSTVIKMDDINARLSDSGVKVLGVMRPDDRRAYRPFQENIYNGTYPLTRRIFMFTVSPTSSLGGGFYSFVTGRIGQKIIMKTGIMPARTQIQVVELVN